MRVAKRVLLLELPGLPEKGDVSDWLDSGGTISELKVFANNAPEWSEGERLRLLSQDYTWLAPSPFVDFNLPQFPTNGLPKWLREFVEATAVSTQTPPDLGAAFVLGVLSTACANRIAVKVKEDWTEKPAVLYLVVSLAPGNLKTAVASSVFAPVYTFEAKLREDIAPRIRTATIRRRMLEADIKLAEKEAAHGENKNERDKSAKKAIKLNHKLAKKSVPVAPQLITDDATPEALVQRMEEQGGRMAVLAGESDLFELIGGRYDKKGKANLAPYLKGHAGDPLRVDRASGQKQINIAQPALTVAIATQPSVINGLAHVPGFKGRGLLARFLYSLPASWVGKRNMDATPVPDQVTTRYREGVIQFLEAVWNRSGRETTLALSPDAHEAFHEFRCWVESRLGIDGDLEGLAGWGEKLPGAVARIAGLMHVAANSGKVTSALNEPISKRTMKNAIRIGEYFIPHTKAAHVEMGADTQVAPAQRVLRWIETKGLTSFSEREAFEALKGQLQFSRMAKLRPLLDLLEEKEYIQKLRAQKKQGPGRSRSPVYLVNPSLNSHNSHNSGGQGNSANLRTRRNGTRKPSTPVWKKKGKGKPRSKKSGKGC